MKQPIIIENVLQGSQEWLDLRCAVITASAVSALLTKGRGNEPSKTRISYLASLAAQKLGGKTDSYQSYAMRRGSELEPFARLAYEAQTGSTVREVGFVFSDENRIAGCSPDGLIGSEGGLEIKCPESAQYMKLLLAGDMAYLEYAEQIQFSMWCTGRQWWDFEAFNPEFSIPMLINRVIRDQAMMERFDAEVPKAAAEIQAMIDVVMGFHGAPFDEVLSICKQANEHLDMINDNWGESSE